jgi:N6-adenosine-specific RNA methylase IME4
MSSDNWFFKGLEPNAYGMIVCDPPWRWSSYSDKGLTKSPQAHYDTMSLDEIKALPIGDLAAPEGAFLWLWSTAPMHDQIRTCVDAWGFTYSTQGVWVKTVKDNSRPTFGTGFILRNAHEPFIIARKGKPKLASRSVRSVIMAPRREHSRKPEEAYRDAEKLAGDVRRADVFSRQLRPGWDAFGNETTLFDRSGSLVRAA